MDAGGPVSEATPPRQGEQTGSQAPPQFLDPLVSGSTVVPGSLRSQVPPPLLNKGEGLCPKGHHSPWSLWPWKPVRFLEPQITGTTTATGGTGVHQGMQPLLLGGLGSEVP